MKKLRFAIQVIVLIVAFPVLFIVGITHPENKADHHDAKKEEPVTIKSTGLHHPAIGLTGIIKYFNII